MQHVGVQVEHDMQQQNGHDPVWWLAPIGVRGAK